MMRGSGGKVKHGRASVGRKPGRGPDEETYPGATRMASEVPPHARSALARHMILAIIAI
jgi:hypothetical protein